jgi:hypothetical protein
MGVRVRRTRTAGCSDTSGYPYGPDADGRYGSGRRAGRGCPTRGRIGAAHSPDGWSGRLSSGSVGR